MSAKSEKNIASNFSSSFYITCLLQFQLCYFLQRLFFGGLGLEGAGLGLGLGLGTLVLTTRLLQSQMNSVRLIQEMIGFGATGPQMPFKGTTTRTFSQRILSGL